MSKEIKDYLHLYIGQHVYIFPDDTVGEWLDDQVKKLPDLQWKVKITSLHLDEILKRGYKPILRDLSDMTEEEAKKEFELNGTQIGMIFFTFEDGSKITPLFKPEQFQKILSKGFDLFGLIPAKLAINAKELNHEKGN